MKNKIKDLVEFELKNPNSEFLLEFFQYGEINSLSINRNLLTVNQINHSKIYEVYYPLHRGRLFLQITIEHNDSLKIIDVVLKSGIDVYFLAKSKDHSLDKLSDGIENKYIKGWSKGESHGIKSRLFTSLKVRNTEINYMDPSEKIDSLMSLLHEKENKFKNLISLSDCILKIIIWNYSKETRGFKLTKQNLQDIHQFNLGIDVEYYLVDNLIH